MIFVVVHSRYQNLTSPLIVWNSMFFLQFQMISYVIFQNKYSVPFYFKQYCKCINNGGNAQTKNKLVGTLS